MNADAVKPSRRPTAHDTMSLESASGAVAGRALVLLGEILRLGVHERPNLVALNPLALEPAHRLVLVFLAGRAHVQEELGHGIDGHVREAAGGAEAVAFRE